MTSGLGRPEKHTAIKQAIAAKFYRFIRRIRIDAAGLIKPDNLPVADDVALQKIQ